MQTSRTKSQNVGWHYKVKQSKCRGHSRDTGTIFLCKLDKLGGIPGRKKNKETRSIKLKGDFNHAVSFHLHLYFGLA